MEIKRDYTSPRWTAEITDCSMPMTFDTYSRCAYNCQYCFSFFQKSHSTHGYTEGIVRSVDPKKVINLFECERENNTDGVSQTEQQFFPYIQARKIMQWGGLADEFDEYERRFGLTLELLNYFDSIDYPLSFSTKGTWWTEDSRYMELFRKHTHNWHVKISVITMDAEKARKIEKGVPSPQERIEAIHRLAEGGQHVTLRLRPYIIGVSDDYPAIIKAAHEAGADSVTTEFFCMETRADDRLKKRYAEISKAVGYDIYKYYMGNSKQMGYKRLNRRIKAPIIHKMRDIAHSYGMRFHVSDAYCRECNDACNCCGVPPEWGCSQTGNIGRAILIAKEKGYVRWSDISEPIDKYLSYPWTKAAGYNTNSNKERALLYDTSMAQWLRMNWNNINSGKSPAKGYGGVLIPDGKDEAGDVIYRYAGKKKEQGKTQGEDKDGKEARSA